MSIFAKHQEQDRVAGEWLLDYLNSEISTKPGSVNIIRPRQDKWVPLLCEVALALPPHLSEFLRFRQEVGNVRYWVGPVSGKYVEAGKPVPTRLTMWRYWKILVDETVRFALKEGLL